MASQGRRPDNFEEQTFFSHASYRGNGWGGSCYDCGDPTGFGGELCSDCEDLLCARLRIPDGSRLHFSRVRGAPYGDRWKRWRVDIIYSLVPVESDDEPPAPGTLRTGWIDSDSVPHPHDAYLWRQVARKRGSPLHLTRYWTWDGPVVELHGLESGASGADLLDTAEGLALFLGTNRRGRPRGSTSNPDLRTQVRTTYRRLLRERKPGERLPSQVAVSEELGIEPRTFRRNLKSLNIPWPPTS